MADFAGKIKADLLIRWHGSHGDPTVIATVELPIRSEGANGGMANLTVDASVFEHVGKAIADALEQEADPARAVTAAQQRLAEAMAKLSPNARQFANG